MLTVYCVNVTHFVDPRFNTDLLPKMYGDVVLLVRTVWPVVTAERL